MAAVFVGRRSDGGGVPAPARRLRHHRRARHQAGRQFVRRTEEPSGLRTDDHAMVTRSAGTDDVIEDAVIDDDDVMCLFQSKLLHPGRADQSPGHGDHRGSG